MMKYGQHKNCGGEVVDEKPHYIPLGEDTVLEIIDQTCTKCGGGNNREAPENTANCE